jgi:pheromone shutdown protein TraB
MANRYAPFQNTLTILKDKESNKELYLIGSTHSSQLLAERTKELIKELKPDLVYLQSNQKCLDLLESL